MKNFKLKLQAAGVTGLVLGLVVACGGGGGANLAGIDRLGVSTGTITGFGSVFVNGVEYSTTGTAFDIDDAPGSQSDLQVGQQVTVQWSSVDEGVTRRAVEVFYDDSVEGPITAGSIDPLTQSFVVLGQTVLVDADTSFASPLIDLDSLADGNVVEVSGLLQQNVLVDGVLVNVVVRATRIERKVPGGEIEIRGTVSNPTVNTFVINGQVVLTTINTIIDAPSGVINNGDFVEVKGTVVNGAGQLVATRVELEDGEDRIGEDGDEAEVEGYVTLFTSASSFSVSGVPVQSSVAATGGTVALGAKVRVEGEFNASGAIVASEVQVRTGADGPDEDTRIAARVDTVTPNAGNPKVGQFVVLGVTILVDANTRLEDQSDDEVRDFSLADLQAGVDYVEVRGIPQGPNTVLATLLERQDAEETQGLLRGSLGARNDPDFTILGVLVETDDFTTFFDADENEIAAAAFFAGAVTTGAEVKVKFLLNIAPGASTPVLAEEVEIED